MRKRLVLVLVAALVAIGTIGAVGTSAWFTDTDTLPSTASAGTLDIEFITPSSITLSDLMPGDETLAIPIEFRNMPISTTDVEYRIRAVKTDGSSALWNKLNVELQGVFCGGSAVTVAPEYSGAIKDLLVESPGNTGLQYQVLPVNFTACVELVFELDPSAGNTVQGTQVSFDIVVDATQPDNPGWSQ